MNNPYSFEDCSRSVNKRCCNLDFGFALRGALTIQDMMSDIKKSRWQKKQPVCVLLSFQMNFTVLDKAD